MLHHLKKQKSRMNTNPVHPAWIHKLKAFLATFLCSVSKPLNMVKTEVMSF